MKHLDFRADQPDSHEQEGPTPRSDRRTHHHRSCPAKAGTSAGRRSGHDVQRIVVHAVAGLREEMHARFADVEGHFDAIYQRFDRLEERLSA